MVCILLHISDVDTGFAGQGIPYILKIAGHVPSGGTDNKGSIPHLGAQAALSSIISGVF